MSDRPTKAQRFTLRARVRDQWWPWRCGAVTHAMRGGRVHVQWDDGETWKYDRDHVQFLERVPR